MTAVCVTAFYLFRYEGDKAKETTALGKERTLVRFAVSSVYKTEKRSLNSFKYSISLFRLKILKRYIIRIIPKESMYLGNPIQK